MHHLPVRYPFSACAFLLLPLCPFHCPLHPFLYALVGAYGDVGLHAALPEGVVAVDARCVYGPPDTVLVITHVAVSHCYGFYVRVYERLVPRHRVGHAVYVIPPARVEADEMPSERGAYLHQLESRFVLLDEDIDLYGPYREAQVVLQRRKQLVPESGFFRSLYFGEVEHDGRARLFELLIVVDDV